MATTISCGGEDGRTVLPSSGQHDKPDKSGDVVIVTVKYLLK